MSAEEMSVPEPVALENEGVTAAPEAEQVQEAPQKKTKTKRTDAENWAEAQKGIKERDRHIYELRAQLESVQQKSAPPVSDEDELSKMSKDDILTVAQAEKMFGKRAEKIAKTVVKKREAAMVDERLGMSSTIMPMSFQRNRLKF